MTREQITEMLAGLDGVTPGPWERRHTEGSDVARLIVGEANNTVAWCGHGNFNVADKTAAHIARCDPGTIRTLCELALEGWALRAENERLRTAMVKARDGLRWSQTHLREADVRSVSVEAGLDAAEAALERKPE